VWSITSSQDRTDRQTDRQTRRCSKLCTHLLPQYAAHRSASDGVVVHIGALRFVVLESACQETVLNAAPQLVAV